MGRPEGGQESNWEATGRRELGTHTRRLRRSGEKWANVRRFEGGIDRPCWALKNEQDFDKWGTRKVVHTVHKEKGGNRYLHVLLTQRQCKELDGGPNEVRPAAAWVLHTVESGPAPSVPRGSPTWNQVRAPKEWAHSDPQHRPTGPSQSFARKRGLSPLRPLGGAPSWSRSSGFTSDG